MKNVGLLIVFILLLGCKKEKSPFIDTVVYLRYNNANGDNLLNATIPGAINTADIDVYVLKNGIKTRVFNGLMDSPENFSLSTSIEQGNLLSFSFFYEPGARIDNKVVMFIKYKDDSEDKLTGEFNSEKESNIIIKKVFVNDVLKWERAPSGPNGIIELIK